MPDIIKNKKRLTEIKKGQSGTVVAITHKEEKVRKRLNAMGIYVGCTIIRENSSSPIVVQTSGIEVAIGKEFAQYIFVETNQKVVFLLGNPNVGKSTVFSRLTGVKTDTSNYPGTTVSLLNGEAIFGKNTYNIYDMPGVYSLEEDCKTSSEACRLLTNTPYDIAVYVADSQHLERNLFFAMDTINLGKPLILLLNKFDVAQKKGIDIDVKKLSEMLGVPVIACNGLTGMGLSELSSTVDNICSGIEKYVVPPIPQSSEDKWKLIGRISAQAQKITHRHPSFLEKFEEAATSSVSGIIIALLVMVLSFMFILNLGEWIIDLLSPLYANYYLPFIQHLFAFAQGTFIWTILIGGSGAAGGFGILTEGIKISFIDVMPYVVIFYSVLEFLGDLGYLPRLSILLDSTLHKVGLHGYSAIPIMLGFGCKVPAIMAVRSLETRRQRVIAFALILMMVPCISQTAMMFTVLAPFGVHYLVLVFAIMIAIAMITGILLNRFLPGDTSDIFMEVPSWQVPKLGVLIKKVWYRAREYIVEAVPLIMLGVLIISLADMVGIISFIGRMFSFPVHAMMGLPAETASVMALGFLRKDVSIALLMPFNLSPKQLVTACVFMAMYMPCMASFFVLLKEGGWKDTLKIIALTLSVALLTGTLLNVIL